MQIHANNLALSAGRGPVYGPLTFNLDSGLSVLRGDAGSGRTSLLLTLAGRMKHDAGTLLVAGLELPRQLRAVQKLSAVAGFSGIDSLEESVTVGATLRERLAWLSPWWSVVRKLNDDAVAQICAPIFGGQPIPAASTLIWDLDETEKFLLRIALAMMGRPKVLFVDDIEQIRNSDSRAIVWHRLAAVAAKRTDVVVSASSLDAALWEDLDMSPHIIDISVEPKGTDAGSTAADSAAPGAAVVHGIDTDSIETTPLHELIKESV
ncbi:ATP-binding cassette domain-containing protein [Arthrobacter sp.]|uniref:ATP-binding cassette domain-containing protein n=1 Tax=Arthrobacter sp. TaxID=1667 RepID=UPI0026E0D703|nr:ATP-binding cassette domain-containing protein [Arthrobacter sp.]MDO5753360.1 AAA family ATPase [Arthrobacter sp.]